MVRLRWYGPRSLKPDQKIYVEKKIHREPWTEEAGYKVMSEVLPVVMSTEKQQCTLRARN